MCPWYSDVHRLSQFLDELTTISSPKTVEALAAEVKGINARWQDLIRSANQREVLDVVYLCFQPNISKELLLFILL